MLSSVRSNQAAHILPLSVLPHGCTLSSEILSFILFSLSHGRVLFFFCIPGSGLVEPWRVDVWAFDWRITLHSWWRWELAHRHCQVWIFPDHRHPQYSAKPQVIIALQALTLSVSHITGESQRRILLSPKIWDHWPKTSSRDSSSKIQRRD